MPVTAAGAPLASSAKTAPAVPPPSLRIMILSFAMSYWNINPPFGSIVHSSTLAIPNFELFILESANEIPPAAYAGLESATVLNSNSLYHLFPHTPVLNSVPFSTSRDDVVANVSPIINPPNIKSD